MCPLRLYCWLLPLWCQNKQETDIWCDLGIRRSIADSKRIVFDGLVLSITRETDWIQKLSDWRSVFKTVGRFGVHPDQFYQGVWIVHCQINQRMQRSGDQLPIGSDNDHYLRGRIHSAGIEAFLSVWYALGSALLRHPTEHRASLICNSDPSLEKHRHYQPNVFHEYCNRVSDQLNSLQRSIEHHLCSRSCAYLLRNPKNTHNKRRTPKVIAIHN